MNYAVGVDLGGTFVKMGLVDERGRIVRRHAFATADHPGKGRLIAAVTGGIEKLLTGARRKRARVTGIGVGVPGLVDSRRGIARQLVNVPGWKNVPLKRLLEKKIHLAVFIDNDVNLMALGEFTFGAGKGTKNLLCLTLGTGVGGGLIIDGEIYRGSHLAAGEIGHVPVSVTGPRCGCGGRGCLEAYVGNRYLVRQAARALASGRKSKITKMAGGDWRKITPEILSRAARAGDTLAREIWEAAGTRIGVVLVGMLNVFDPEMIVIGGGISRAGRILFSPLNAAVKARTSRFPSGWFKIVPARLGDDAGVIGAAVLVGKETKKGKRND